MTKFRLFAPFAVLALVLTACPAGDDGGGDGGAGTDGSPAAGGSPGAEGAQGEITVTSLWGGAEAEAFQAVLDAFAEQTNCTAQYDPQRTDYATVLQTRVQGGTPPDVAIIPGIGFLRDFARDGSLIPLSQLGIERSDIEDNYAPGIVDVGVVDDELYALMVKLNSKSTFWYRPNSWEELGVEPPETWDDMLAAFEEIKGAGEVPMALGAADSWTLTDWFENIYLLQHGPEMYDQLFSGEVAFNDESVKESINTMLEALEAENVVGGIDAALGTQFVDAIGQVFGTNPQAQSYYEGGFVGGIVLGQVNPEAVIGEDIDFVDFPTLNDTEGAITIGGDVMAAFTDEPCVSEFMNFMASPEAGQVWAEQGTIVSPLREVDASVYPNELAQKEAEQVANAEVVRFDGSDLLPAGTDLGAVLQGILQDPDSIDGALDQFSDEVSEAFED